MNAHVIVSLTLAAVLLCGCKSESRSSKAGSAGSPGVTKFVKHEVVDHQATHMVVSTYLLPEHWKVQDKFMWDYADCFTPVRYEATWTSGDGLLEVHAVPDIVGAWYRTPMGNRGIKPPATLVNGIKDYLRSYAKLTGLKFIDAKTIPGPQPADYRQGMTVTQVKIENGIVKIEYEKNNQTYEGEIYGTLTVMRTTSSGYTSLESINWTINSLSTCSAPKGRLEECKRVALTIRSSARMTLPFYNRYCQVQKLLQDQAYARIYQAGQLSRIISQTNDQISKSISDGYWERQRSNDRINQNFSDYVRGVDRYTEPGGTEVQLPSGYGNAWVNNRGEYLVTDQSGYNPNVELNGDWKQLEKRE